MLISNILTEKVPYTSLKISIRKIIVVVTSKKQDDIPYNNYQPSFYFS